MRVLNGIMAQHTFTTKIEYQGNLSGPRHFGKTGQLHFLEKGNVRILIQGKQVIQVDRPAIVIVPAAVPHMIESIGDLPVKMINASISLSTSQDSFIFAALPDYFYFQLNPECKISCTAKWLIGEITEQRFARQSMLDKLTDIFVLQIFRFAIEEGLIQQQMLTAAHHPLLSRVIKEVHQFPATNWNLNNMAKKAAMSRTRFAKSFKEILGQTPKDYVTDIRLAKAQRLLLADKSLNFIASEVGYEHPSALTRIFKKKLGQTPRQWLKLSQKMQSQIQPL